MNPNVLLTDLYQLTMLQGYFNEGMNDLAVFEFFIRRMPSKRNFFIAAGLEQLLCFLENLQFTAEDIAYLDEQALFTDRFLDSLKSFRFTGDVFAMPEGTIFFPNEPIVQVIAPIPQAQLIESRLINLLHLQTMIASKAVRSALTAPGKQLIDFGMRRAHGAEAALFAARASYLAGFDGTATVLAGKCYGIPIYGTMAHSYIQAYETEEVAFSAYARSQPKHVVLLIDTYNTEHAAHKVAQLAMELREEGIEIKAVRLDSGDLAEHAARVRRILDNAGCYAIKIFCSGDIDEYRIQDYMQQGCPIDGFGVGTKLDTSSDMPYLDSVYKLQEYAGIGKRKCSEGKATWPGRKQVYRYYDDQGYMAYDRLSLAGEDPTKGEPLLQPVMRGGKRIVDLPAPTLAAIRSHVVRQLSLLPESLKTLKHAPEGVPVKVSTSLKQLADAIDEAMLVFE